MRVGTTFPAAAVGLVLILGGVAAPAVADQATRSNDPSISSLDQSPADLLRAAVEDARATYRTTIAPAKETRDEALAAPRAERKRALKRADTKAERRAVRRAYRKAAAPIKQEYRTARSAARAARGAAIEAALADYLVSTGKPDVADALKAYRSATQTAQETLELALQSGRAVFRTDTADEREQLLEDLDEAGSAAEVAQAWADFVAACADERAAHAASIAAARATYLSAQTEARAEFRAETGITISSLLKLPFKI